MRFSKTATLLVAIAAIAGPTAALGSSGDDQYCDPFAGCGTAPSTTTSTPSKPSSGGQGGGRVQGGSGGGQGDAVGPTGTVVPGSVGSTGGLATARDAAAARRRAAHRRAIRRAQTKKCAGAVLDAAGLSPVRTAIVAR